MVDLMEMIDNLSESLPAVERLIFGAAYIVGLFLTMSGVYRFKEYGELRTMMSVQTDLKGPLVRVAIGAMLIYLPTAWRVSMRTLFGQAGLSPLEYASGNAEADAMVELIVGVIRVIGYLAFIRGWILLASAANKGGAQPGSFGRGLTHLVGGLMAINVVATKNLLLATVGV